MVNGFWVSMMNVFSMPSWKQHAHGLREIGAVENRHETTRRPDRILRVAADDIEIVEAGAKRRSVDARARFFHDPDGW